MSLEPKKTYVSWTEALCWISELDKGTDIIYGIPRGGMILAGFAPKSKKTFNPAQATLFVDDIIDSGKTRDEYAEQFPGIPFVSMIDKTGPHRDAGWIVFPWEKESGPEDAVIRVIEYLGDDPRREGLLKTPERVIRSWGALYSGYRQDPTTILNASFSTDGYDEMVTLKDIEFYSTCEHHVLPFFGKAKVAYIPSKDGRVVGVSKLARLVDCFARRLQIQERMTQQIAWAIQEVLNPLGVGVRLQAQHLCMMSRGVAKQNSIMTTTCLLGAFREQPATRAEFLAE